MTPDQEAEAIEIELELRKRRGTGGAPAADVEVVDAVPPEAKPAVDWAAMKPAERLGLMAEKFPEYLKREVIGDAKAAEGIAERSVPIAVGQFVGRLTRIPAADRILGALGGAIGETVAEYREGGDIKPGRVAGAAVSGLVRGKPLAKAPTSEVVKEAGKYATQGVTSKTVETVVDEGRLPTVGEAATAAGTAAIGAPAAKVLSVDISKSRRPALYGMEDEILRDLKKEGVVVPPHEVVGGFDTLSSFGGKAALHQDAAKRNQFVWQKLAREDIGLSKESLPIRPSELLAKREQLGAPYREIQTIQKEAQAQLEDRLSTAAKMPSQMEAEQFLNEPAMAESIRILKTLAAANVDDLKAARAAAAKAREAFFVNKDPTAYEPWQKAKALAEDLEEAIDRAGQSLRDDKLLARLREARVQIAKTYAVEEALNPGNGFVDPAAFGRQLLEDKHSRAISGNLEKIAKFQLAFRREAVEAGRVPAPGVGNVGAMATTGMASRGDAPGIIGAVGNMTIGPFARPFLLSDMVQGRMLDPIDRQNFSAVMARYITETAAERSAETR